MTGEPLPHFSADPVVDWCVKEAATLAYKVQQEEDQEEAEEQQRKAEWKSDFSNLPQGGMEPADLTDEIEGAVDEAYEALDELDAYD
jgi:hypothetical protein